MISWRCSTYILEFLAEAERSRNRPNAGFPRVGYDLIAIIFIILISFLQNAMNISMNITLNEKSETHMHARWIFERYLSLKFRQSPEAIGEFTSADYSPLIANLEWNYNLLYELPTENQMTPWHLEIDPMDSDIFLQTWTYDCFDKTRGNSTIQCDTSIIASRINVSTPIRVCPVLSLRVNCWSFSLLGKPKKGTNRVDVLCHQRSQIPMRHKTSKSCETQHLHQRLLALWVPPTKTRHLGRAFRKHWRS